MNLRERKLLHSLAFSRAQILLVAVVLIGEAINHGRWLLAVAGAVMVTLNAPLTLWAFRDLQATRKDTP